MVSNCINSRYFETYFVLKYCIFCQICSKSVYPSISAILQCMLCFLSCGRDTVFVLLNAYNPLFSIVH